MLCATGAIVNATGSAGMGTDAAAKRRVNFRLRAPHAFEARGEATTIAQTPFVFGGGHHRRSCG